MKKPLPKTCHIAKMLQTQAKKKHISFHTPGHKRRGYDITELSYSDNLSAPRGCIRAAEEDIRNALHSACCFILTDGSTSGVLALLKASGVRSLALPENAHKSVFAGCALLHITPVLLETETKNAPLPAEPGRDKKGVAIGGRTAPHFPRLLRQSSRPCRSARPLRQLEKAAADRRSARRASAFPKRAVRGHIRRSMGGRRA